MTTVSTPRKVATTVTSSATLAKGRHTPVDATTSALTLTLPTDAAAGVELSVEKVDASGNAVTVSGTLRGVASSTIALTTQYEARTFLSEGSGSWRPTSDHRTASSLSATFVSKAATIDAFMAQPTTKAFIGHRGSPNVWPEHSMDGYRYTASALAVRGSIPALKLDFSLLADGKASALMHDSSLTRTATVTGNVSDYDAAGISQVPLKTTTVYGPGWTLTPRVPLWTSVLDEFGDKAALFIEHKTNMAAQAPATAAEVIRRGLTKSVAFCDNNGTALNLPALVAAVPGGSAIHCQYTYNGNLPSVVTPAAVIAAGYKSISVGIGYTDADITTIVTAAHAAGVKVTGFTYLRRYDYDRMVSLGIDSHMANDVEYIAETGRLRSSVPFSQGTIMPGWIDGVPGSTGWTWVGSAGSYRPQLSGIVNGSNSTGYGIGFGMIGPFPSPAFNLAGTFIWDTVDSNTAKQLSLVLSTDDRAPNNGGFSVADAVNFNIGQGGWLNSFVWAKGAYNGAGGYANGTKTANTGSGTTAVGAAPNPTAGQSIPWTLTRSSAGLYTFGALGLSISFTHTAFIPKYLWWNRDGTGGAGGVTQSASALSVS